MIYWRAFKILMGVLPTVIQIIKLAKGAIDDAKLTEKINADLGGIGEAFRTKDADALRNIFNS